jgi:hypothetical protein
LSVKERRDIFGQALLIDQPAEDAQFQMPIANVHFEYGTTQVICPGANLQMQFAFLALEKP